tara:strand:+ start:1069 stop:1269 length:201 start_codon:yes stop_codon:yes gene_type:complete
MRVKNLIKKRLVQGGMDFAAASVPPLEKFWGVFFGVQPFCGSPHRPFIWLFPALLREIVLLVLPRP